MKKKIIKKRLGEVLIERGLISHEQLDQALAVQKKEGGLLGEILVKLGNVTEDSIAWALAMQYGIPYLPVHQCEIPEEMVKLIPKEWVDKHRFVPVDRIGNILTVAMANPLDQDAVEMIESKTGCSVRVFISTMGEIDGAAKKLYKPAKTPAAS